MGRKRKPVGALPSEFEMQILGVLWQDGSATVRQVLERLTDGKPRAYTSVLSAMQVMQKKGLLAVEKEKAGLANVYRAVVTHEDTVTPLLRGLVQRLFGGSTRAAVQHMLDDQEIDRSEIKALRQLLDDVESRSKKR